MTAEINPKDCNVINIRTYMQFFVEIFYCVNTRMSFMNNKKFTYYPASFQSKLINILENIYTYHICLIYQNRMIQNKIYINIYILHHIRNSCFINYILSLEYLISY